MTDSGPSAWLASVVEIVRRITDRWAKAGALAAIEYRLVPRPTFDADLVVAWDPRIGPALESAGYTLRLIAAPGELPHLIIARKGEERVDLMFPTVDYQEVALARAVAKHLLTVEDVLVHKLIAWRPRDIDDVASILAKGHSLDREYIERWAEEFDVLHHWREATGPR